MVPNLLPVIMVGVYGITMEVVGVKKNLQVIVEKTGNAVA